MFTLELLTPDGRCPDWQWSVGNPNFASSLARDHTGTDSQAAQSCSKGSGEKIEAVSNCSRFYMTFCLLHLWKHIP